MSDVRALLKAKRAAAAPQIQHPYAGYSKDNSLRCTLCAVPIKLNTQAGWTAHLESKTHKANVEREQAKKGKRKADLDSQNPPGGMDVDSDGGGSKKRKTSTEPSPAPSGFPADFFSDPSRAPPPIPSDEEDEDNPAAPPKPPTAATSIDTEFEAFERAIAAASASRAAAQPPAPSQDVFARATVFAEPELIDATADGFPEDVVAAQNQANGVEQTAPDEEETEAQKLRRKEQEEKELIMDRIMEEERAQEEAEDKVRSLKARLESIRKQRELKKKEKEIAKADTPS